MRKYKGKINHGTEPKFIKKSHEELMLLLESLYKVRQKYYRECDPIYKKMEELGIKAGDYEFRENVFVRVTSRPTSVALEGIPVRANSFWVTFYREVIE